MRLDPLMVNAGGVNPEEKPGAGVTKAVWCRLQHLATPAASLVANVLTIVFLLDLPAMIRGRIPAMRAANFFSRRVPTESLSSLVG